jgi:hypothetical protein
MKNGMLWAGSTLIEFLSGGVSRLMSFLSECTDGRPDHDIDLYRERESTQKFGVRFAGMSTWDQRPDPETNKKGPNKAGAVRKFQLISKQDQPPILVDVDEVNLFKRSISPSTDLWPNLCAVYDTAKAQFTLRKMHEGKGPPLSITRHNALRFGTEPTTCYVLRERAWPMYGADGAIITDENTCDGRFRGKLNKRRVESNVDLVEFWKPGPRIPPHEVFLRKEQEASEDEGDTQEEEGKSDEEKEEEELEGGDEVVQAWGHRSNVDRDNVITDREQADHLYAMYLSRQSETNPHGESMRNTCAPKRCPPPNSDRPRRKRRDVNYSEK